MKDEQIVELFWKRQEEAVFETQNKYKNIAAIFRAAFSGMTKMPKNV